MLPKLQVPKYYVLYNKYNIKYNISFFSFYFNFKEQGFIKNPSLLFSFNYIKSIRSR